jgi:putative protease
LTVIVDWDPLPQGGEEETVSIRYTTAMSRVYNNKQIELLAPAGTFEIFKELMHSSCDAVYCGGSQLNMRMIRKGYNLSREELREAVFLAREADKNIYITVNSLLDENELAEAEEYLIFLEEIGPDAIIIQDTAILSLINRLKLSIPLHASVMMNVHNTEMINVLEAHGIKRVVLSREMPLSEVKAIAKQTNVELEYFTHGDMCVAHGSLCYYSSYLFGMSSNRGRCLKPCRWPYTQPTQPQGASGHPFSLAVKDMNLYAHLRELLDAGVVSFKIEGRMRSKEFITGLVDTYGRALDAFLADPLGQMRPESSAVEPFKKRDFSTGYAFGVPGLENINTRGEGTGDFYSTKKMFSTPTKEREVDAVQTEKLRARLLEIHRTLKPSPGQPGLSVRVNSIEQGRRVLKSGSGIRRIYLSSEPFAPVMPFTLSELDGFQKECRKSDITLFLAFPRMVTDSQFSLFRAYLAQKPSVDGFLLSNLGLFRLFEGEEYQLTCDSSMNIYNPQAAAFYEEAGAKGWTSSIELPAPSLIRLPTLAAAAGCTGEAELIYHGLPDVMYLDHDVSGRKADSWFLETEAGRLQIKRDYWNHYHLLPVKELTLMPLTDIFMKSGYDLLRLELQAYGPEETSSIMKAALTCMDHPEKGDLVLESLQAQSKGCTYGAYQY